MRGCDGPDGARTRRHHDGEAEKPGELWVDASTDLVAQRLGVDPGVGLSSEQAGGVIGVGEGAVSAIRRSLRAGRLRSIPQPVRWCRLGRAARLDDVRGSGYNRHPLPPELLAGLAALVLTLGALFLLGAITYAYRGIGIGMARTRCSGC